MLLLPTASASTKPRAIQYFLRWRNIQALIAVFLFFTLLTFLPSPTHDRHLPTAIEEEPLGYSPSSEASRPVGRVFIASLLRDSETILRGGWSDAVVNLTRALGPENVWVSIHESGSRDGTKRELQLLDDRLRKMGAGRKINMAEVGEDMHSIIPKDGPGWINVDGKRMRRRIPWLAELRNLNLDALVELGTENVTFDKALFLNDVVFTSDDALELLRTRGGHYAAACGFDFSRPWPSPTFYDQFATRDIDGQELESLYFPYFSPGESRAALLKGLPAPVKSCWSGIAAFDARPFQNPGSALRFRAINDSLADYSLEASECCLIHYDNPMSSSRGVWMNPNVRVAYEASQYNSVHRSSGWPSASEIRVGHISSWWTWLVRLNQRRRKANFRLYNQWAQTSVSAEAGAECLVHKMMVVSEKGKWSQV